jgi:hypothetical protein
MGTAASELKVLFVELELDRTKVEVEDSAGDGSIVEGSSKAK